MKRAVVVLAAFGVLCGCGGSGEEQPKALPPVVATGSAAPRGAGPTSTGTPTAAVAPTERDATPSPLASVATGAEEAAQAVGAEQFAKKWVEATDRAFQSLDVTELQSLSDPSCVSCQNYLRSVRHKAEVGETYRTRPTVIRSIAAPPLEHGETVVLVDVSVPEGQVLDREGVVTKSVPPLKTTLNVRVRRTAGRWLVLEVTRS